MFKTIYAYVKALQSNQQINLFYVKSYTSLFQTFKHLCLQIFSLN